MAKYLYEVKVAHWDDESYFTEYKLSAESIEQLVNHFYQVAQRDSLNNYRIHSVIQIYKLDDVEREVKA